MVSANKRVLVVDDEEIVRDSCWRVLTDAGYTVRTVSNGRDALRACRSEPVDLMLTDIRMPDMDGIQVARTIRKEFPGVQVLIITGYPSRQSADQAQKLGIFDYLEKPLSPSRLSAATAAALESPPRRIPDEVLTKMATDSLISAPETSTEHEECERSAPVSFSATTELPVTSHEPPCDAADEREQLVVAAPASDGSTTESQEAFSTTSPIKTLGLMAISPLLGLAFVVFLPLIGFGVLFAALGSGLVGKLRSAQG